MTDETADLFINHEDDLKQREKAFYDYCEHCAAELQITVDYFIAEFV
jgi:hypothetical protein